MIYCCLLFGISIRIEGYRDNEYQGNVSRRSRFDAGRY